MTGFTEITDSIQCTRTESKRKVIPERLVGTCSGWRNPHVFSTETSYKSDKNLLFIAILVNALGEGHERINQLSDQFMDDKSCGNQFQRLDDFKILYRLRDIEKMI